MSDQPNNGASNDAGNNFGNEFDNALNNDLDNDLDNNGNMGERGLRAYATVGEFMASDGWHPQALDENFVYRAFFVGHNGEVTCFAQVRPDLDQFIFYVVMPVRAPAQMRLAMAEYLTRANYGLRIGNFELDFEDGEVRYKSSLDFEGMELTPMMIRNSIYPAVQTMDRYLPGAMGVIFGGKAPEDAINEIESEA